MPNKSSKAQGSSRRKPLVTSKVQEVEDNLYDSDSSGFTKKNGHTATVENGIDDLPEGTVIVQPEDVSEEEDAKFEGPEFVSSLKTREKFMGPVNCTVCSHQINTGDPSAARRHPVLKVLLCKRCYRYYRSGDIQQDSDGLDEQCRWCGEGGNLICCDDCNNAFCKACIKRNLGRAEMSLLLDAGENSTWRCYVCNPMPLSGLIEHCNDVIKKCRDTSTASPVVKSGKGRHDTSTADRHLLDGVQLSTDITESNVIEKVEILQASIKSASLLLHTVMSCAKGSRRPSIDYKLPFDSDSDSKSNPKGKAVKALGKGIHAIIKDVLDVIGFVKPKQTSSIVVNGTTSPGVKTETGSKKKHRKSHRDRHHNSDDDDDDYERDRKHHRKTSDLSKIKNRHVKDKLRHSSGEHREKSKHISPIKEAVVIKDSASDANEESHSSDKRKKISLKIRLSKPDTSISDTSVSARVVKQSSDVDDDNDEIVDNNVSDCNLDVRPQTPPTHSESEVKMEMEDNVIDLLTPVKSEKTNNAVSDNDDEEISNKDETSMGTLVDNSTDEISNKDELSTVSDTPRKETVEKNFSKELDANSLAQLELLQEMADEITNDIIPDSDDGNDDEGDNDGNDDGDDVNDNDDDNDNDDENTKNSIKKPKSKSKIKPVSPKKSSIKASESSKSSKSAEHLSSAGSDDESSFDSEQEANAPSRRKRRRKDKSSSKKEEKTESKSKAKKNSSENGHDEKDDEKDEEAQSQSSDEETKKSQEKRTSSRSPRKSRKPSDKKTSPEKDRKTKSKDKTNGHASDSSNFDSDLENEIKGLERSLKQKKKRKAKDDDDDEEVGEEDEEANVSVDDKESENKDKKKLEQKKPKERKSRAKKDADLSGIDTSSGDDAMHDDEPDADDDDNVIGDNTIGDAGGDDDGNESDESKNVDSKDLVKKEKSGKEKKQPLDDNERAKKDLEEEMKDELNDDESADDNDDAADGDDDSSDSEIEFSGSPKKGKKRKKKCNTDSDTGDNAGKKGGKKGGKKEAKTKDVISDDSDSDVAPQKHKGKGKATSKLLTAKIPKEKDDEDDKNSSDDFQAKSKKKVANKAKAGKKRKRDNDADGSAASDSLSSESSSSSSISLDESDNETEAESEVESGSGSGKKKKGGKGKKGKGKKRKGKGKKGKKGKAEKGKKRKRIKIEDSSEEGSGKEKKEKKEKADSSEEVSGKEKKKKKEKVSGDDNSDSDSGDSDDDDKSPSKGKRKEIRKLKGKKDLEKATRRAAKAEQDRRKRITDRQKEFNWVEPTDPDAPQQWKTLESLVLEKEPFIQVLPDLVKKLKPHQVDGVQFMWDCLVETVERRKKEKGSGCILAHCMGLGKTLSVITLVHTLLTHYDDLKFGTCLVICPLNTVLNWKDEWAKWLKEEDQLEVVELLSIKDNWRRADALEEWQENGGIMIMGYEMFRMLSQCSRIKNKKQKKIFTESLIDPGPDIIVCDEGHILKNDASGISKATTQIKSQRRIVLTGTPLQNNLVEYHCMVNFVKPNLLGSRKEFMNRFGNPISNGQCSDSTGHDVRVMKRRAHILHDLLSGCVQRRDYSALTKFLPPKYEFIISVRLSAMQISLYEKYLESHRLVGSGLAGEARSHGTSLFADYQFLMRIWTHPWVLKMNEIRVELKAMNNFDETSEDEGSDMDSFIDDEDSEKSMSDSSNSDGGGKAGKKKDKKKMEEEMADSDSKDDKNGAGPSTSSRNTRARKRNGGGSSEDEVVKDWKTRTRNGLEEIGESSTAEEIKRPFTKKWWGEDVSEGDQFNVQLGGKMVILLDILRMCEDIGDKVLVFSQSLLSLDLIEDFLAHIDEQAQVDDANKTEEEKESDSHYGKSWTVGADYFRMDGSTQPHFRKRWSETFNDEANHRARLFLISTKAGSLGINLVAANRVIVFDASWNPSHDIQSIFRVYRFGQTKPVYVYRLLAQGTMEEKIYERQVIKQSLSQRVVDEQQIERHFSSTDLQELYKFKPERLNDPNNPTRPTPMLPKDAMLAEMIKTQADWIVTFHEHDSLLEHKEEDVLTEEERKIAWEEYENEKKGIPRFPYMAPGGQMPGMMPGQMPGQMPRMMPGVNMPGGNHSFGQPQPGGAAASATGAKVPNIGPQDVIKVVQAVRRQFPNLTPEALQVQVQAVLRNLVTGMQQQEAQQQRLNQQIQQEQIRKQHLEQQLRLHQQQQQQQQNAQYRQKLLSLLRPDKP